MRGAPYRKVMDNVPTLRGEKLYIPCVAAIIERRNKKEILIQTRMKKSDAYYSGTLEITGGKMRAFEDIFTCLRREVKEETGLDLTHINGENQRIDFSNRKDISSLIEPFCVTQMQTGPFIGIIFLCEAEGELLTSTDETKDIRWMDLEELRQIVDVSQERIYTPSLGPLKKYLSLPDNAASRWQ